MLNMKSIQRSYKVTKLWLVVISQIRTSPYYPGLITSKINILGGNNKQLFGQLLAEAKGEPILGSVCASPNIRSPLSNKSDIGQQPTKYLYNV